METLLIQQLKQKVEALWQAIASTASAVEKERLRAQYRQAIELYRRQKLITESLSAESA